MQRSNAEHDTHVHIEFHIHNAQKIFAIYTLHTHNRKIYCKKATEIKNMSKSMNNYTITIS